MKNNFKSTDYKGITYTAAQITEMLNWLKDLTFADEVDFDSLTEVEIIRAVARHWEGGLADFIECNA